MVDYSETGIIDRYGLAVDGQFVGQTHLHLGARVVKPTGYVAIGINHFPAHRQPVVERVYDGIHAAHIDRIDVRHGRTPFRKRPFPFIVGHDDDPVPRSRQEIHRKRSQSVSVRSRKLRPDIYLLSLFVFPCRFVEKQYREIPNHAFLFRNRAARRDLFVAHVADGQIHLRAVRLRRTEKAIVFHAARQKRQCHQRGKSVYRYSFHLENFVLHVSTFL